MSELVAGVLQGLAELHLSVLYLLAGLFTTLETSVGIGLLVPGDSVVLLAGTTATTPHRYAALVAVTVLGSLAGESVGYLLGRRYGTQLRTSRLGRRLGEGRWAAAETFLAGGGGRAVAAARFVALVHALVPVVAGTVGMSYRRLVGWSAVGAMAWSVLYVGIGAAAGASWRRYGDRVGLVGLAVFGAALAILLMVRAARRRPADPSAATAVTVVDQLPEGLEVVALPAECVNDADPTAEPDTITCSFGTLAAGASASVSIDVVTDASRADDTLPYVNTARVTTSTYEQDTSDNADTETTPVVPA